MLFWETGAVGDMTGIRRWRAVLPGSPRGEPSASAAISFMPTSCARCSADARSLRFAVANVDDVYGRRSRDGALDGSSIAGAALRRPFVYDAAHLDPRGLARGSRGSTPTSCSSRRTSDDGSRFAGQMVRQGLRLSPASGRRRATACRRSARRSAADAVGLFASDKPDSEY